MSKRVSKFSDDDITLLKLLSDMIAAAMFFSTKYDSDALFHQTTHDGLTGLANRSLFMDRLRNQIGQSERDQRCIGLLMLDMNGLKQINDTYGHRIGDAAIVEFAKRISAASRATDTVARLGGDEFGVILTPVDLPQGIESSIRRMTSAIEAPYAFEGTTYPLRASIGSAQFPADGNDIHALLELADQRMYAVKQEYYRQ